MAFTPKNTTCPIKVYTFPDLLAHNLATDVLALADPTTIASGALAGMINQCTALQIQNNTTGNMLILESAVATKGIIVAAGQLWAPPEDTNGNGYDVSEFWLKASVVGDVIVFRRVR